MPKQNNYDTASWDKNKVREAAQSGGERKPRRRRRKRRGLSALIYLTCVVLVSALLAGIGWLLFNDLCSLSKEPVNTTIVVEEGDSVRDVANKLKDAGLIKYPGFFCLTGKFLHAADKIEPGTYKDITSDMDYRCLINSLHHYESYDYVRVTIPEGMTFSEIVDILVENEVSTREALEDAAANYEFADRPYLDPEKKGNPNRVEGFLFPDTYDFYIGGKPEEVLDKMMSNFDDQLTDELRAEIDASDYSLAEIVTIASIIEKEGNNDAEERANIASVIYNRLGAGWRLQLDSTINYINKTSTFNISYQDLEIDSPYNTYLYEGLPIGPICNPSLGSIEAALHPNSTDYWYWYAYEGTTSFFTNGADFDAYAAEHPYE